jgi:hypothetical protein
MQSPLRRNETSVPIYVRLTNEISRGIGNELCVVRIFDERREDVGNLDPGGRAKSCGAPTGKRNGRYRHGGLAERRAVSKLIREARASIACLVS